MQRAENQANRTEKLLKGGGEEVTRSWFQSHKQRQEEKGIQIIIKHLYYYHFIFFFNTNNNS